MAPLRRRGLTKATDTHRHCAVTTVTTRSGPDAQRAISADPRADVRYRELDGQGPLAAGRCAREAGCRDVSLLRSAGALLRGRAETPERELALSLVDLAVLRALQSATQ